MDFLKILLWTEKSKKDKKCFFFFFKKYFQAPKDHNIWIFTIFFPMMKKTSLSGIVANLQEMNFRRICYEYIEDKIWATKKYFQGPKDYINNSTKEAKRLQHLDFCIYFFRDEQTIKLGYFSKNQKTILCGFLKIFFK